MTEPGPQERRSGRVSVGGAAAGIISFLVVSFATRRYPALGVFGLFMAVSGGVGAFIGGKALRTRPGVRRGLTWLCLLLWLLPFLGVFAASAVLAGQEPKTPVARERIVSVVGLVLSVINGAWGTITALR